MTAQVEQTAPTPTDEPPVAADFLFHLYRGSELLHDHRLLEAQTELEYALTLEPADARTLGLLAVAYFRSGFFARAIAVYRALLADFPEDASLRLNLALCYLKTGQTQGARVELEALVVEDVTDRRAWGYLAVALDRLGYAEQAGEAFVHAGHVELANRVRPGGEEAPGPLFDPLDAGDLNLALVDGERRSVRGTALVRQTLPPDYEEPVAPRLDTLGWGTRFEPPSPSRAWLEAPPLANFIEDARIGRLGDSRGVTILAAKLARVELDPEVTPRGFAFRLESLRSYAGGLDRDLLPRQARGDADAQPGTAGETFGGIGTPFASMKGAGQIIVGPRATQRIMGFVLRDDTVFFREDAIVGFDLALHYENGRLGGGEGTPLVQLRGDGTVLLELAADLLALEVKAGGLAIRKEVVVGWVGRLLPRSLLGEEAPCGQRGLVGFSGEGIVLVTAK